MPQFDQKTHIWVPNSHQDRNAAAVAVAVREYDPDLSFGRNEQTGQWCIFLKQGTSSATVGADLPVLGFQEIPHPDDALRRLHQADALRTGRKILDNIERHNEALQKDAKAGGDAAIEETAEAYDWAYRQMGKAPYAKSLRPVKGVGY